MSHEDREHRSAPVLTKEQVDRYQQGAVLGGNLERLIRSHEALRAERDELAAKLEAVVAPIEAGGGYAAQMRAERDAALAALAECGASNDTVRHFVRVVGERNSALAEVARMRPVVDAALAMKDCRDHTEWVRVAPRIGSPDNAAQARRADNDRVLDKFYFAVQVYREQAAKEVQP